MIVYNLSLAGKQGSWHIRFKHGKITGLTDKRSELEPDESIEFDQELCLPGFINSHDHLDFNLFPQLADKIYTNYAEWGPSIQKNHKEIIEQVLKVPEQLR